MWRTIGHDRAVNHLRRSIDEDRLSHAYLVSGPQSVGKMTLAMDIARAANCVGEAIPCATCDPCDRIEKGLHADVQITGVESERSGISINQIRAIQQNAALTPYEGRTRVFILSDAEHLTDEASNSLLKTLEEPPGRTMLILLTRTSASIPETIISRCHLLELRPVPVPIVSDGLQSLYDTDADVADETARLSTGLMGWAIRAVTDKDFLGQLESKLEELENMLRNGLEGRFIYAMDLASTFTKNRDRVRGDLELLTGWWRDVMLTKQGLSETTVYLSRSPMIGETAERLTSPEIMRAIGAVDRTMDHLERNANPRLALENLMLVLPQC